MMKSRVFRCFNLKMFGTVGIHTIEMRASLMTILKVLTLPLSVAENNESQACVTGIRTSHFLAAETKYLEFFFEVSV